MQGAIMKTRFVSILAGALAIAFPQAPIFAQGPPPVQPYIQVPIPVIPGFGPQPRQEPSYDRERWEHCERLRDREHDIRERLAYVPPYSEERERLEHRLREVHYERERCGGR
jgi:hypothetical protein